MTSLCITILVSQMWWLMHLVGSNEKHWLETMGQFRLQYSEQTQGTLGSLVATPSRLSRVIES